MIRKTTIMTMALLTGMLVMIPISASADIDDTTMHYPFDGHIIEFSGNNHDGTITGTEEYSHGEIRDAFDFDGSTLITVSDHADFEPTKDDAFSLCAWVRLDDSLQTNTILDKNDAASANSAGMTWSIDSNNNLALHLAKDGSNKFAVNTAYSLFTDKIGTWQHVCSTYDGVNGWTGITHYVNATSQTILGGTHVGSVTTSATSADVTIGSNNAANDTFDGAIDDLRYYFGTELTSSEVQEIYELSPFVQITNLKTENTSLQNQITSVNATVQHNVTEINDLYDFWDDLRASIITWLAGRP